MPKMKSKRGAVKRFRTTASGKHLDMEGQVSKSDMLRVRSMLPYGRP